MLLLFTNISISDVTNYNIGTIVNVLKQDIHLKLKQVDGYLTNIKQEIVYNYGQNNYTVNLTDRAINIGNPEVYIFINTLTEGITLESGKLDLYISLLPNQKSVYNDIGLTKPLMQDNIKEIYVN